MKKVLDNNFQDFRLSAILFRVLSRTAGNWQISNITGSNMGYFYYRKIIIFINIYACMGMR